MQTAVRSTSRRGQAGKKQVGKEIPNFSFDPKPSHTCESSRATRKMLPGDRRYVAGAFERFGMHNNLAGETHLHTFLMNAS